MKKIFIGLLIGFVIPILLLQCKNENKQNSTTDTLSTFIILKGVTFIDTIHLVAPIKFNVQIDKLSATQEGKNVYIHVNALAPDSIKPYLPCENCPDQDGSSSEWYYCATNEVTGDDFYIGGPFDSEAEANQDFRDNEEEWRKQGIQADAHMKKNPNSSWPYEDD